MNLIKIGTEYGIDFKNADGVILREYIATNKNGRNQLVESLVADDNHHMWPVEAVTMTTWERPQYRNPICGLDYGAGSVSRRFGGYTPRSAYQTNGER